MKFREHELAHKLLDGLDGIEIGGSAHNPFNIPRCKNVDYTDSFDTVYKRQEIALCGEALPVDIVADASQPLPFDDNSLDYVLSSHVIEHLPNPILSLNDWHRIIKPGGILFVIGPQPDALPSDRGRPLTTIGHLIDDHFKKHTNETHPDAENGGHWHIWNLESFKKFMGCLFRDKYTPIAEEERDSKVGNGWTYVARVIGK